MLTCSSTRLSLSNYRTNNLRPPQASRSLSNLPSVCIRQRNWRSLCTCFVSHVMSSYKLQEWHLSYLPPNEGSLGRCERRWKEGENSGFQFHVQSTNLCLCLSVSHTHCICLAVSVTLTLSIHLPPPLSLFHSLHSTPTASLFLLHPPTPFSQTYIYGYTYILPDKKNIHVPKRNFSSDANKLCPAGSMFYLWWLILIGLAATHFGSDRDHSVGLMQREKTPKQITSMTVITTALYVSVTQIKEIDRVSLT